MEKARKDVEGYEKKLNTLRKDIAGLNLSAGYAGKLMEVATLNPGDTISKDQKVATLADDTHMRLEQYYSYAYAGDLKAGQTVSVSIPALMSTISGTVEAVHMVSRITPEGSKLFSADIVLKNDGALTADMVASATVTVNGETVYPYEPGKLEYYRTGDLKSTVNGTVISSDLVDYLQVTGRSSAGCALTVRRAKARSSRWSRAWKRPARPWRRRRRIWITAMLWLPLTVRSSV